MEVVARLKALEEAAAPLVTFLQNANAVQELRADKQYNLLMLNDRYQVPWISNVFVSLFFKMILFSVLLTVSNGLKLVNYDNYDFYLLVMDSNMLITTFICY